MQYIQRIGKIEGEGSLIEKGQGERKKKNLKRRKVREREIFQMYGVYLGSDELSFKYVIEILLVSNISIVIYYTTIYSYIYIILFPCSAQKKKINNYFD